MHRSLNAKAFPHFMERDRKSYRSTRPLGRIYDRVNLEKFSPAYEMPFDERILKRFQLTADELTKASEVKAKYDVAMRRLMGQHERPISEFEVFSAFILSKPRVGNDYKLAETVGREVSSLKSRFRIICAEALTGVQQTSIVFSYTSIDLEKLDRFVAAMYTVTHDEVQAALRERSMPVLNEDGSKIADDQGLDFPMPLISFPWLFHKELARVAKGGKPVTRKWKNYGAGADVEVVQPEELNVKGEFEAHAQVEALDDGGLDANADDEQDAIGSKEGAGPKDGDRDYVRTGGGDKVKRGQILSLFDDNGAAIRSPRGQTFTDTTSGPISSFEVTPVETPLSPQSENRDFNYEDVGDIEYEEVYMVDGEDENALDELARIIAGK